MGDSILFLIEPRHWVSCEFIAHFWFYDGCFWCLSSLWTSHDPGQTPASPHTFTQSNRVQNFDMTSPSHTHLHFSPANCCAVEWDWMCVAKKSSPKSHIKVFYFHSDSIVPCAVNWSFEIARLQIILCELETASILDYLLNKNISWMWNRRRSRLPHDKLMFNTVISTFNFSSDNPHKEVRSVSFRSVSVITLFVLKYGFEPVVKFLLLNVAGEFAEMKGVKVIYPSAIFHQLDKLLAEFDFREYLFIRIASFLLILYIFLWTFIPNTIINLITFVSMFVCSENMPKMLNAWMQWVLLRFAHRNDMNAKPKPKPNRIANMCECEAKYSFLMLSAWLTNK